MRRPISTILTIMLSLSVLEAAKLEMGIGLWYYGDWGRSTVYKDLMRQARPWYAIDPRQGEVLSKAPGDRLTYAHGGMGGVYEGAFQSAIPLDDEGWPREIKLSQKWKATTLVMADWNQKTINGDGLPLGDYTLIFKGSGTLWMYIGGAVIDMPGRQGNGFTKIEATGGETRRTFHIGPEYKDPRKNLWFVITIDESRAEDPIRDISFIMTDENGGTSYADNFRQQPYYPPFVKRCQPFSVLRLMDWCSVMRPIDKERLWSNRPLPDYTRAGHFTTLPIPLGGTPVQDVYYIPWEWMIDMGNALQKDIWITLHHKTDEAYWTQLAKLIKQRMAPGRKCYIEYSNEVWAANWTAYNDLRGYMGGGDKAYTAMSCRLFKVFDDEFAGENDRIVKVLAGWQGNDSYNKAALNNLKDPQINPHNVTVDRFSTTTYFGNDATRVPDLQGALINDVAKSERDAAAAAAAGVPLVPYEGGFHCMRNCAANARTPEMYDVYKQWLESTEIYMPTLLMHYALVGAADAEGHWGMLEYLHQDLASAHKYRAVYDFALAKEVFDPNSVPPPLELEGQVSAAVPAPALPAVRANRAISITGGDRIRVAMCVPDPANLRVTVFNQAGRAVAVIGGRMAAEALVAPGYYIVRAEIEGRSAVAQGVLVR